MVSQSRPRISAGSSVTPNSYVARKVTRHYYSEVAEFLRGRDESVESFDKTVADAFQTLQNTGTITGTNWRPSWKQRGDYFFAAVVRDGDLTITAGDIAIGAFLDYGPAEAARGETRRVSTISHVAMEPNLVAENPQILPGFFRLLQRSASARNSTHITVKTALGSPLVHFFARNGYQILSHEFKGDANVLSVKFKTDLVPAYAGDVFNWAALCRWYLGLTFGQHVLALSPEDSEKGRAIAPVRIDVRPSYRSDVLGALDPLKGSLPSVPVNAVIVPTADLLLPTLATDLAPRLTDKAYNIALLDCKRPATEPTLTSQCRLLFRDDLEQALKIVRGLYFDRPSTLAGDERWQQFLRLKSGFERKDRDGIIVEIDRESYVALLSRLTTTPKPQRLLFLNDGGFGEAVQPGCRIYFYIWDALAVERDEGSQVPGVIAAAGRVAEIKPWSFAQLRASWPDLKRFTIFDEFFAEQYFSEPVVGFFLDEIECIDEVTIDDNASIPGVSYDELLSRIFPSREGPRPLSLQELLPSWDIKNAYLNKNLSGQIYDKLKALAGSRLTQLLSLPGANSGAHNLAKPTDPTEGAAYYIENPPRRAAEAPPDVFFSFAGADENPRGWKTYVMDRFRGSLEGEGFQPPYAFDEGAKRAALGRDWAAALVERMSVCRTAVIMWSPYYISSFTCRELELPYLLWRRAHQDLKVYFLRLEETAQSRFKWEGVDLKQPYFDVEAVNDDRMAVDRATSLPSDLQRATLQGLRDRNQLDLLNSRLQGTLREIINHLKTLPPAR